MNEYLVNEEAYLRCTNFLAAVRRKAAANGSNLLEGLNPKDVRLIPTELYIISEISGGGTQHLLNGETRKLKGVTNFDGDKLGSGVNFVADAVTLHYGEAAEGTKLYEVDFNDPNTKVPSVILASEIVVRQGGQAVINLPISAIQDAKMTDKFFRELGALALLVEQQEIEITIELPSASEIKTESDKKPFVLFKIRGFKTNISR